MLSLRIDRGRKRRKTTGGIENGSGVGIGQRAAAKDGVLEENVVGVDDSHVHSGQRRGANLGLVPTGREVIQQVLEIDNSGLGVSIEITEERGCLGVESRDDTEEEEGQRSEER